GNGGYRQETGGAGSLVIPAMTISSKDGIGGAFVSNRTAAAPSSKELRHKRTSSPSIIGKYPEPRGQSRDLRPCFNWTIHPTFEEDSRLISIAPVVIYTAPKGASSWSAGYLNGIHD